MLRAVLVFLLLAVTGFRLAGSAAHCVLRLIWFLLGICWTLTRLMLAWLKEVKPDNFNNNLAHV